MPRPSNSLRVGTRGSALALVQADLAVAALRAAAPRDLDVEIVTIRTSGDASPDTPFTSIGPKGIFAAELQRALVDDRIDAAVHSLKDLPSIEPDGLVLAAVLEREDPRDVLVSRDATTFDALPPGAVVGTSSVRRRALVAIHRPDLVLAPLRGNVDTRLRKIADGEVDAAILAGAGLLRLRRADAITEWLDPVQFTPPPGQGAIVIEMLGAREDLGWVAGAEHADSRAAVDAERAFMLVVEGGCDVPLGAWARFEGGNLVCDAFISTPDGSRHMRDRGSGSNAPTLGAELAQRMLDAGARDLSTPAPDGRVT